jgi:Xaa-Pro aminopeptidase
MDNSKKEIYYNRIEKIRSMMIHKDIDCLLLFSPITMYYFSGYSAHKPIYPQDLFRLFPLAIPKKSKPFHIATFNNYRYVKEESIIEEMHVYDEFKENAEEFIAKIFKKKGLSTAKIGIEENVLVHFTIENLKRTMPGVTFLPASDILMEVRDVKDEQEIDLIQHAIDITIKGYETAFKEIKPGRTEREVASLVESAMILEGAEGFVEETQMLAGERSKLVRARASNNIIKQGDVVIMDMAAIYKSYGSDISRPVVVGEPTERQKNLADVILKVYETTLSEIKPGVVAGDIDDYVRETFQKYGYGPEHQAHLVGHGFGLNFHENPIIKPESKSVFKEGMIFAFEPAVAEKALGHMRFEDDFIVTKTGTKCLSSKLPRELKIL